MIDKIYLSSGSIHKENLTSIQPFKIGDDLQSFEQTNIPFIGSLLPCLVYFLDNQKTVFSLF